MEKYRFTHLHNPGSKKKRILFMGGRLTIAKEDGEGFEGNFGMSASEPEKDYVHIIQRFTEKVMPGCAFCTTSSCSWEKNYKNRFKAHRFYKDARNFKADVMILQLGDYIFSTDYDRAVFERELDALITYLSVKEDCKLILLTPYESRYMASDMQNYAHRRHYPCLFISDLLSEDCNITGLYKSIHGRLYPDDDTHRQIAKAVLCIIEKFIRR